MKFIDFNAFSKKFTPKCGIICGSALWEIVKKFSSLRNKCNGVSWASNWFPIFKYRPKNCQCVDDECNEIWLNVLLAGSYARSLNIFHT